jgi:hypothetical protein
MEQLSIFGLTNDSREQLFWQITAFAIASP